MRFVRNVSVWREIFEFEGNFYFLYIYSGVDRGEERWGYIPSNIWQGVAYVIIPPPMLWKVNNILTYLYKYQTKSTDFALKTADF